MQTRNHSGRWFALVIAVGAGVTPAGLVRAQTPPAFAAFDIVSIRRNADPQSPRYTTTRNNRDMALNQTTKDIIMLAYGFERLAPAFVQGGPGWIESERYDIEAIAPQVIPNPPPGSNVSPELRTMLKAMLADRYKLSAKPETREAQIYALVMAKKDSALGTKMKPATIDCINTLVPLKETPPANARFCNFTTGAGWLRAERASMADMVRLLAFFPAVNRPVQDRTGLAGEFEMDLTFVPAFIDNPNNPTAPPIANPAADAGATLFTALPEQLGIRLEGQRGSVEFLVISGVERPSENSAR